MAGNSQRRGAVRKDRLQKGATVGSAASAAAPGQGAHARSPATAPNHKAHKFAKAAAKVRLVPPAAPQRRTKASSEMVAGRNSVLEALRADIPVATMYVAGRIDADDRVRKPSRSPGNAAYPSWKRLEASSTDSRTTPCTKVSRSRCRPMSTRTPSDFVDPQTPAFRSSSPSTASPTRATSAPSSGPSLLSGTRWSCRRVDRSA